MKIAAIIFGIVFGLVVLSYLALRLVFWALADLMGVDE